MSLKVRYEDIKRISFWVVPDPGSFTFAVTLASGEEIDVLITQAVDLEDIMEDAIPGRIYVNSKLIALQSEEENDILDLLSLLLRHDELGHREGLAVITVKSIIEFFRSGEAQRINEIVNNMPRGIA